MFLTHYCNQLSIIKTNILVASEVILVIRIRKIVFCQRPGPMYRMQTLIQGWCKFFLDVFDIQNYQDLYSHYGTHSAYLDPYGDFFLACAGPGQQLCPIPVLIFVQNFLFVSKF